MNDDDKNDLIVRKYTLLREKIIQNYEKGCKILNTAKIIFAIVFMAFTVIAVHLSNIPGRNKGNWLVLWIFLILFSIAIFTVTDYCKHLVKEKVIPYLQNDEQIEFGRYAVFGENDDEKDDEDDDDEEDDEK